jgi:hypothetical protein
VPSGVDNLYQIWIWVFYFKERRKMMEQKRPIWIDEKKVSKITGRAIQTLRNDCFHGRGIPYYKIGRSVRYQLKDVYKFMEAGRIVTG